MSKYNSLADVKDIVESVLERSSVQVHPDELIITIDLQTDDFDLLVRTINKYLPNSKIEFMYRGDTELGYKMYSIVRHFEQEGPPDA